MPAQKSACPHPAASWLGADGDAQFYRCNACGEVLVIQRGRAWRLAPRANATR
jgi:hypothetical protein